MFSFLERRNQTMIMLYEGRPAADLSGIWKYKKEETEKSLESYMKEELLNPEGWRDIQVPNNWYLTEIGDYFGTIWFRTEFETPDFLKTEHV